MGMGTNMCSRAGLYSEWCYSDAPVRRCVCTHQVAALFCVKWRHPSWSLSCKYVVTPEIRLRQSMRIYSKNNRAKFRSDPIWNDGALGFFEEVSPTTRRRTTTWWVAIWDMRSVPDQKMNSPETWLLWLRRTKIIIVSIIDFDLTSNQCSPVITHRVTPSATD